MNSLDLIIFLFLLFFGYQGFRNGLVKEVMGIVGLLLAVFFTFRYMEEVSHMIRPMMGGDPSYLPFVSGAIIFVLTLVFVNVLAYLISKLIQVIQLGIVNRLFGLAFGMLKSGILISAILLLMAGFNTPSQQTRHSSAFYPYVIHLAPWSFNLIATVYPGASDFDDTVRNTLKDFDPLKEFPFEKNNSN